MNKSYRGRRNPVGIEPATSYAISGSNNVQNARPMIMGINEMVQKANPLFPHYQQKHKQYSVVKRGEMVFNLTEVTEDKKNYPSLQQLGSFDELIDSVWYLPATNSLGDRSEVTNALKDISNAQRAYRGKVRFFGLSFTEIQNQPNLYNHGNIIITSKGKMTIPNTGYETISEGDKICWDICTDEDYDRPDIGLKKLEMWETDRRSLLTMPAYDHNSTVRAVRDIINDPDNWDASFERRHAVLRFWESMHHISLNMKAFYYNAHDITTAKDIKEEMTNDLIMGMDEDEINSTLDGLRTLPVTVAVTRRLEADPQTTNWLSFSKTPTNKTWNVGKFTAHKLNVARKVVKGQNNLQTQIRANYPLVLTGAGGELDLFDNLSERAGDTFGSSVEKLVQSIADLANSEQRRFFGMAVTPAAPGKEFDVVFTK